MVSMTGADEIDADTIDLINQLCTRVGMLMEDAAPLALHRPRYRPELDSRLLQLRGQRDVDGFADRCCESFSNV